MIFQAGLHQLDVYFQCIDGPHKQEGQRNSVGDLPRQLVELDFLEQSLTGVVQSPTRPLESTWLEGLEPRCDVVFGNRC